MNPAPGDLINHDSGTYIGTRHKMDIKKLLATHPAYEGHAQSATYLQRSYLGGTVYRAGEYLTRYIGEQTAHQDQYSKRLAATPLDNQVQTTIDIYRSFLFRELPHRHLGSMIDNPLVHDWLTDTDQEGQGMDSFLKTANDLSMIMGNVWILVDKPSYRVQTQAEEIALGIRAYACVYTAQNVLDWEYERDIAGKMRLTYIKVKENETPEKMTITLWDENSIIRYVIAKDDQGEPDTIVDTIQYDNMLGYVPFINHAPIKGSVRGTGHSLVGDVADAQKFLYNLYSELEQSIRISSHPTLVKTASTSANAGAGSIINIQEDLDPGLLPFLLQPTAASISGMLATIDKTIEGIQRMTHTSAVQAVKGAPMSGVALSVERQLLNAKLSDLSDTLSETENAMWAIFSAWQGIQLPEEFEIEYSQSFDIRDSHSEIELVRKAIELVPTQKFRQYLLKEVAEMMVDDAGELRDICLEIDQLAVGSQTGSQS